MEKKRTYGVWAVRSSTSIFGPAQSWCKENGKPLEFDTKAAAENYAKEANEHTTANVRYYVKEKEPEPGAVRKGTSQPELDARSHEEVIPRNDAAEKQNEIPGRQIPSQTDPLVEIRSAVHSNYAGMVAMLGADNRVYLGREERCHYQNMQPSYYDNQDGSLCFVCDQPDMYYFLYGEGWAHTQAEMLERGLTLRQYEELGEDFYNFQSVIYIVPDHICNKLTSANTFRYMMADKTISYDIAQELKSYFENSSLTDSLVTYNITMRTIEVNDNSAIIFIMQTGLTYSAIILFVTCFTILALQQLSDSGKYKYRFRVLRNMGVEEPHIRKLILKQLAVWFGVPIILALILSGAFLVFLFVGFHMQIAVYIGVQRLVQQLLIVLAILGVLLISYFISTWVLFNKSASA